MKKQKGITLVALIISIIILLILAGISIQALTNQGLFAQAEEAKKRTENAQKYEDEMLKNYLEQMNDIIDEKKNTYTIIYNLNEGEGTIENQTKIEGENINLTTLVPTRENYTFLGWSTNKEATEPEYLTGAIYNKDENIELFAIWEKTKIYLYNKGNECEEITGGWDIVSYQKNIGWTYENCKKNTNNLFASTTRAGYSSGFITINSIDLTDIKKIYMYVDSITVSSGAPRFNITDDSSVPARREIVSNESLECGINELDVSLLNGKYYVAFGTWRAVDMTSNDITVEQIWLEK